MAISNVDELKEALKDHPSINDIMAYLENAIDAEKQTGISSKRRANQEAQSLRRWKQVLEEAGYDGDADGVAEWLQAKAAASTKPGEPNPEIDKLRKEFAKAQKALEDEKQNASKIKTTADRRSIKAKLIEAFRDKVYGHDLLADSLINDGKVKLTEDEQVVFVNGEDEVEFGAGVKKLLESRPDLVKNTQAPGARSGTRPTSAQPRYSLDQLKNMSANDIAADMANVLESVKSSKT